MDLRYYSAYLKRFFLLLAVYMLCRILFYILNFSFFAGADASNTVFAFIHGIRYDLSILALINIPFTLLSIIPARWVGRSWYQTLLKGLYLVINVPFIFLNLVDIEFFRFTGKRTHFDIIGIAGDIADQSLQLAVHFWYIGLVLALMVYLMIRMYPSLSVSPKKFPLWGGVLVVPVWIGVTIFMIRGGTQYKPLRPNHAFVVSPNVLGNVTLNTPFTFLMTSDIKGIGRVHYFKEEELKQILKVYSRDEEIPEKKDNVVILILESFGSEYLGVGNTERGYTPFLDSLAGHSVFFTNHFANGKRSIEALPSILASIPSLMDEPYITSIYQSNKINGLGTVLMDHGYHTSFFHGGRNGTMGFDVFAQNAGFLNYYGLNEYPEKERDYDGNWGIYDEPFLRYFGTQLSSFPQPFASCVFTLSSHQPYSIPEKYKDKFPKGTLEIHESIGYADFALRQFFEYAQKQSWYKNTLFIITADHTQMHDRPEFKNLIGDYKTPLLFFHPGQKLQVPDTAKVTQHADIMPSVLDYLNITSPESLPFGKSVFSQEEGFALNYSAGAYNVIYRDNYLRYSDDLGSQLVPREDYKVLVKKNLTGDKDHLERNLKALIQFYRNGLIDNNWYQMQSVSHKQ